MENKYLPKPFFSQILQNFLWLLQRNFFNCYSFHSPREAMGQMKTGKWKYLTLQSFLCLSLHLYKTQEVIMLQTQFKTHKVNSWLCYAVWWMFKNMLIYKFQPTNMAGYKNRVIFFLGAGTLYNTCNKIRAKYVKMKETRIRFQFLIKTECDFIKMDNRNFALLVSFWSICRKKTIFK